MQFERLKNFDLTWYFTERRNRSVRLERNLYFAECGAHIAGRIDRIDMTHYTAHMGTAYMDSSLAWLENTF